MQIVADYFHCKVEVIVQNGQSHYADFYLFYFFRHKLVHIGVLLDLMQTGKCLCTVMAHYTVQ